MGYHAAFRDLGTTAFLGQAELGVEALSAALSNIPREKFRMHLR